MKFSTVLGLQIVMWMVCAFHVLMGAGLNTSTGFVYSAAEMYGADVTVWSPQFLYILRPLGVFMLGLGVLAGAAAMRPIQYRAVIYVFAGIFIARALQRLAFGAEINDVFGIGGGRNVANMVFFLALAAVLIVLDVLAHRSSKQQPLAATQ